MNAVNARQTVIGADFTYRWRPLQQGLYKSFILQAEVLREPLSWPQWWRGVERVAELVPGDARRVGSRYRIAWRSRVPYELEFDFVVRRVADAKSSFIE